MATVPGAPGAPPGMMLDTAQTARQPQAQDPDEELFVMLVSGLRQHIFGPGEKGIIETLSQADDMGRVLGEVTFSLVREAAHQAEQNGKELVWDVLIGVATEVIDDITELMAAHGVEITDKDREYALLYAQQVYVETSNPSTEDRQAAQQQLGEFQQTGELDQAVSYVQQRGTEAGADPFGVDQMGGPGMMQEQ